MIKAVIFDFDGLIIDTEEPLYRAWQRIYRERGHDLPLDRWLTIIGTSPGPFDPVLDLGIRIGAPLDREELRGLQRRYYLEATAAQQLLPGVAAYLDAARQLDLKVAIASSSSRTWLTEHLERFAIADRFDVIACRDDVTRTKPDPELYLTALRMLGIASDEAIALEDSRNGLTAAKAAGIFSVAVPNGLTAAMDLSHADLRLASLNVLSLGELIKRAQKTATP